MGAYGRLLGWMASQGIDLDAEAPADRITRARLKAYAAHLASKQRACAPVTVASYLGVLHMTVRAMFPKVDWTWLEIVHQRMHGRAVPVRTKHQHLVPADQLVRLGVDLIAAAGAKLDTAKVSGTDAQAQVSAARDFRDGLIIALLALRAPREANLLSIEIGRQLLWQGRQPVLQFAAAEMKNHRPLFVSWPTDLVPALNRYVGEVRGILIAANVPQATQRSRNPPGQWLWVAQGGTKLTPGGLTKALKRHTMRRFGIALTVHRFRDCLATTVSGSDPNHLPIASAMLGHGHRQTTERGYVAPSSQQASAQHSQRIAALRQEAKRAKRAANLRRGDNPAGRHAGSDHNPTTLLTKRRS